MSGQSTPNQFSDIESHEAIEKIARFMEEAVRAFNAADWEKLENLAHPGNSEKGKSNTAEFQKSLFENGDRILRWTAKIFVEPDWKVMREYMFSHNPVFWVDAFLNNGSRKKDYEIFFALSPNEDGELRSCYYLARPPKPRKTRKRSVGDA